MNGEVERQNRSLLKRLAICQAEKGNWIEDLNKFLLMYRSTPHSTTLKTPAELMFNRNIRDKLPALEQRIELDGEVRDRDAEMKLKGKVYADRKSHAKINDIKEGDEVVVKRQIVANKLSTRFEPTVYKVAQRKGAEVTVENVGTGSRYRRNVAHVKKIPASTFTQSSTAAATTTTTVKATTPSSHGPKQLNLRTSTRLARKRAMPTHLQSYDLSTKRSKI